MRLASSGPAPTSPPLVTAAGTAVLLALTGCAQIAPAEPTTTVSSSHTGASVSAAAGPHDAFAIPAPDSEAGRAQVAVDATRAFCRPGVPRAVWAAGLDQYLTLSAAAVYGTVDPARVPCEHVTGAPVLGEGDGFSQLVTVPTDAGVYRVAMARETTGAHWLVFRISPVKGSR